MADTTKRGDSTKGAQIDGVLGSNGSDAAKVGNATAAGATAAPAAPATHTDDLLADEDFARFILGQGGGNDGAGIDGGTNTVTSDAMVGMEGAATAGTSMAVLGSQGETMVGLAVGGVNGDVMAAVNASPGAADEDDYDPDNPFWLAKLLSDVSSSQVAEWLLSDRFHGVGLLQLAPALL
jgi:hypothetical protein